MSKLKRATYRGVGLFANGKQLNRVSAFGATGTLSKEEVFELANDRIVEIVEDSPEVSMTIDSIEHGSLDTLLLLADKDLGEDTKVVFSKDFEHASVPIWNYIKANTDTETLYTQLMTGCVLTGYSANFSTDGNSTENYTLESDNKTWLLNEGVYALKLPLLYTLDEEWEADAGFNFNIVQLHSVVINGRPLSTTEYEVNGDLKDGVSLTISDFGENAEGYVVVSGNVLTGDLDNFSQKDQLVFTPVAPGAYTDRVKRRGHIEVYLFPEDNPEEEIRVNPAQSVSIDASMTREDILALGYKRFYDRPLSLPIDVTASIDVIFSDLNAFASLVGKDIDTADALSLDEFRNDLGLKVKVFDRTDIDEGNRKLVKTYVIPQLIPTDEAWNISLDGQATQTFSFRGMELEVEVK